jgi:hypothetical protein
MKFLHHFGLPSLSALPPLEKPLPGQDEKEGQESLTPGPRFEFA